MSAAKQQATVAVYQLKAALRDITPMIWRRLLVTSDTTIARLHDVLQIAMGWEDLHLQQFRIHGKAYGINRDGGIAFADNPHQVILADFTLRKAERFVYEYDMGDCWQHDFRIEAVLSFDPRKRYPVCTDGAGDRPPEDCGGPRGFMDLMAERDSGLALLEALGDQALVAQRLLDWYDGGPRPTYDDTEFMAASDRMHDWLDDAPIAFNRRAVNATLRKSTRCTSAKHLLDGGTSSGSSRRKERMLLPASTSNSVGVFAPVAPRAHDGAVQPDRQRAVGNRQLLE